MNHSNLDEMQLARRNHIGNQSFQLLAYLLLADIGLSGFGITWLEYPVNIFLIVLASLVFYLIRVILAGAYTGREQQRKGSAGKTAAAIALTFGTAAVAAFAYKSAGEDAGKDNGGLLLFIISAAVLVVSLLLKRWSDRRNDRGDE